MSWLARRPFVINEAYAPRPRPSGLSAPAEVRGRAPGLSAPAEVHGRMPGLSAPAEARGMLPGSSDDFRRLPPQPQPRPLLRPKGCLLYTSDAADDLLCVDPGGRRIIQKKIDI